MCTFPWTCHNCPTGFVNDACQNLTSEKFRWGCRDGNVKGIAEWAEEADGGLGLRGLAGPAGPRASQVQEVSSLPATLDLYKEK